jgi:hypothetical protein
MEVTCTEYTCVAGLFVLINVYSVFLFDYSSSAFYLMVYVVN